MDGGAVHRVATREARCVSALFCVVTEAETGMLCHSQIKKPSLSAGGKNIYLQAPPQLEQATRPNLEKKLSDLVPTGGDITVTASSLPFNLTLRVNYTSS